MPNTAHMAPVGYPTRHAPCCPQHIQSAVTMHFGYTHCPLCFPLPYPHGSAAVTVWRHSDICTNGSAHAEGTESLQFPKRAARAFLGFPGQEIQSEGRAERREWEALRLLYRREQLCWNTLCSQLSWSPPFWPHLGHYKDCGAATWQQLSNTQPLNH